MRGTGGTETEGVKIRGRGRIEEHKHFVFNCMSS